MLLKYNRKHIVIENHFIHVNYSKVIFNIHVHVILLSNLFNIFPLEEVKYLL